MSISISPTQGPQAGGGTVTITTTTTLPATGITVYVNGVSVAFTRVDANTITFTCPSGCGVAQVHISTTGGASNKAPFFYITPPIVTALAPDTGVATDIVTISGYELSTAAAGGATGVTFGATTVTPTVTNDNSITAAVPAGTGTVAVSVTTRGGATSAGNFEYLAAAPTVTSIDPTGGPAVGGTPVTITGTGFTSTTSVDFGASSAFSFTVHDDTSLTATSPAGTGAVNVTVTNPAGTSTDTATFTYATGP